MKLKFCLHFSSLLGFLLLARASVPAQTAGGFAGVGFVVTGGAGGETVTVTTGEELTKYADANPPYIIQVSGGLQINGMDTHVRPNKTILGLGPNAVLSGGGLYLYRSTNVIIRNLTIRESLEDNLGIVRSQHVWVDHCTLLNARDGNLDINRESDFITVSWCKFAYETKQSHAFSSLLGSSDRETESLGKLRVTFHHNWWAENVQERMPSIRWGTVHLYNNYWSAAGNNYCVRTRLNAQSRIENNVFEGVRNPWEVYVTVTNAALGKVLATNNLQLNTTWGTSTTNKRGDEIVLIVPGTDEVFIPPYAYSPEPVDRVKELVMRGAGAGR